MACCMDSALDSALRYRKCDKGILSWWRVQTKELMTMMEHIDTMNFVVHSAWDKRLRSR